jgi:dCMP deaminase
MNRPNREDTLMYTAQIMALRSTCLRRGVGCVIAYKGRIISSGYNGQPQPYIETCEDLCTVGNPCVISIHAEENALNIFHSFIQSSPSMGLGVIQNEVVMYVTTGPCVSCAEKIFRSGIKHLRYLDEYRDNSGILLLKERGINVIKHTYEWQFPKIST